MATLEDLAKLDRVNKELNKKSIELPLEKIKLNLTGLPNLPQTEFSIVQQQEGYHACFSVKGIGTALLNSEPYKKIEDAILVLDNLIAKMQTGNYNLEICLNFGPIPISLRIVYL